MLWVWAQFSEQSRFFVPSIDGAQLGEGGNVPDRCSVFKCDQSRALWFNHRSWEAQTEAQTGSIGPPWHFRAQIVWIQMVPRPKWSKSCFPNSLNGPHNTPMWIWNHQSPLFKADQDIQPISLKLGFGIKQINFQFFWAKSNNKEGIFLCEAKRNWKN